MAKFRAIHTIELKPHVDREEFEEFMLKEFLPAIKALPGCLDAELLRGYKGDLPGVARSKVDYAWITLWESVEVNNQTWSRNGKHFTPPSIMQVTAKLYHYAISYNLVGGFEVIE